MNVSKELMYTKSRGWMKTADETAVMVGLTNYAQDVLGDLVFVNPPEPGGDVTAGEVFGDVESVEAVSDILSPVTGQVEEINGGLLDNPESIDQSPYDAWFVRIKDVGGKRELMDGEVYEVYLETPQTSREGGGPMGSYIPNTSESQWEMLREIGFDSFGALPSHTSQDVRVKGGLKFPKGLGEMEVIGKMKEIAQQNVVFKHTFRGVGAYSHYIPAIVKSVVPKEGFLTSYTPYQAEIDQGILQSIFEYQTVLCELTGMDVFNASVYDGATAVAETAVIRGDKKRSRVCLSATTRLQVIEVVKTYRFGSEARVVMVPEKDGVTNVGALRELLDDTASCLYVQQPNYYGSLEECGLSGEITREKGAEYIMGCNPTSPALLPVPAERSADVAVGDGRPLSMSLYFGDPYLGLTATTSAMGRKFPGRIMGEIRDVNGKRVYVLTLQVKEQHIRREKASPNVCSNQAPCALTANVYMVTMGGEGLKKAVILCTSKVHYLKKQLEQAGLTARYDGEFFHEFITEGDTDSGLVLKAPEEKGILGRLPLNDREILWCATEQNRKEDIDQAAQIVKEMCGG